jgi:hypothetical protein
MLRSSVLAVLASTVLGIGSASACATADLAGDWFATYSHGASGYCTLTVDATGAVTASACWLEKLSDTPKFVLTGALAVDDACKVTGSLTAAPASSSNAAFKAGARVAKALMHRRGGGHGGGDKAFTLTGRLLTGAEQVNGLLVRTNGQFSPVSLTRTP